VKLASRIGLGLVALVTLAGRAQAQPASADPPVEPGEPPAKAPAPPSAAEPPAPPPPVTPTPEEPTVTIAGWVETYFQYNLRKPSNEASNLRLDHEHDSFTVQNAALDLAGEQGPAHAHLTFQVGSATAVQYAGEPIVPPAGSVPLSDPDLWQHLQQAWAGLTLPGDLVVDGGLFLSPIGPESLIVKNDWNWSRSNLFFALPFYHAGVRVTRPIADGWSVQGWLTNGWNDAVDRNDWKSGIVGASYTTDALAANFVYNTGRERAEGTLEEDAWRHLFDANATYTINDRVAVIGWIDGGFETGGIGTSGWIGAAAYLKYTITPEVDVAVRGDFLKEWFGADDGFAATPIFFPTSWVAEGTFTLIYRPGDHVMVMAEYRHDSAGEDVYFADSVVGDGVLVPFVPDSDQQDTVTVGVVAWF